MEPIIPILFVKSEKRTPGPSPDLSSALVKAGYQVTIMDISEVENVVAGLDAAFVIASLPGCRESDLQLCHLLIRAISAPVMVISPLDDVDNRIAALDAGIVDYLVSPVNPLIVAALVRNFLQRHPQNTTRREKSLSFSC